MSRLIWYLTSIALAVILACTTEPARESVVRGDEIAVVNPLIGDASFRAAFGRGPTFADDPMVRVRTHLAYVEARLRERDVSELTAAQQQARTRVLDELHRYWVAGVFPASDATTQLLPTFIDDAGVRCAVADLLEHDTDEATVAGLASRYRNAYVAQIDSPELDRWAARAGLTRTELALIQPSYPPAPKPGIDVHVAASYRYAIDHDAGGDAVALGSMTNGEELSQAGMLELGVHTVRMQNRWLGELILGVDGAAGWLSGNHLAYDAHLRLGTQVRVRMRHRIRVGAIAGLGVDAMGELIPRAVTVPVDLFYFVGVTPRWHVGLVAGPRFRLGGADRDTGWRAGVELIRGNVTHVDASNGKRHLRDVHVGLGVERMADVTFMNLTVALATRTDQGFYEP